MRQVVLDTETTGLDPAEGHRIFEIGALEIVDRQRTGRTFHRYLNPQRELDSEAKAITGMNDEFLSDKPLFGEVVVAFLDFVSGAELIIHNAEFDIGFLDYELSLLDRRLGEMADVARILDSLALARQMHPGMRNSLDALCKRYGVDNRRRTVHGALLDAELLTDVYLHMTGGQTSLSLAIGGDERPDQRASLTFDGRPQIIVRRALEDEQRLHQARLERIRELGGSCLWLDAPVGEA